MRNMFVTNMEVSLSESALRENGLDKTVMVW